MFNAKDGYEDLPVTVPCGYCTPCRLERSRQWAMRCMHEASLHDENSFVTLTYNDEHLPHLGTLVPEDLQKFLKRLRKQYADKRIRFYGCGEYGDKFGRPHYHICLFGLDFDDKVHFSTRKGYPVYTSKRLERVWGKGFCEVGTVTFESAAYVARYFLKKVVGAGDKAEALKEATYSTCDTETGEVVRLEPEFARMSRRPGIGKEWYEKYKDEIYRSDSVIVRGVECRPPRFYDSAFEIEDAKRLRRLKARRKRLVNESENEWERLEAREKCIEARVNLLNRSL